MNACFTLWWWALLLLRFRGEDPALFACWWCGGHAGDHELLAEGQNAETPGSTGPGRGNSLVGTNRFTPTPKFPNQTAKK
eukprot:35039-Amphidinium_carterae.1